MRRDRDRAEGFAECLKIVLGAIKAMADQTSKSALALEDIDHYNNLLGSMYTLTKLHDVLIPELLT